MGLSTMLPKQGNITYSTVVILGTYKLLPSIVLSTKSQKQWGASTKEALLNYTWPLKENIPHLGILFLIGDIISPIGNILPHWELGIFFSGSVVMTHKSWSPIKCIYPSVFLYPQLVIIYPIGNIFCYLSTTKIVTIVSFFSLFNCI